MVSGNGASAEALSAARTALAARDDDITRADRALTDLVRGAHRVAVESMRRIDAIRTDIDSAVARGPGGSAAARELGFFLVAKNREVIAIITEARADAAAKTVALQDLSERYRH